MRRFGSVLVGLCTSCALFAALSLGGIASAQTQSATLPLILPSGPAIASHGKLLGATVVTLEDGRPISSKTYTSRQLAASGLTPNSDVSGTVAVPDGGIGCGCYTPEDVVHTGDSLSFLQAVQGTNPYTTSISLTITTTVSNSWSASGGITAGALSTGLGWDVTHSYGVSATGSANIQYGDTIELDGYAEYANYAYSVFFYPFIGPGEQTGTGTAYQYLQKIVFYSYLLS